MSEKTERHKCPKCGEESIIKVAENNRIDFLACCNEECKDYAELLVEVCGRFEHVHELMNTYSRIVKEVSDEKNQVSENKVS